MDKNLIHHVSSIPKFDVINIYEGIFSVKQPSNSFLSIQQKEESDDCPFIVSPI